MNDSFLDQAWREFHVSRASRDRYDFDQALFATNGNVIFANFSAARLFAAKMNAKRDLTRNPEQAVKAGQINAVGLLDEVLHYVAARYREEKNPRALAKALEWLDAKLGRDAVDTALLRFTEAARREAVGSFSSADDVQVLAAAAAVECVTRQHLAGPPIRDPHRTLTELITKLLR